MRKASFRGVPFGVIDSECAGGRRNALHEFPGKDVPYVEDLGKKARSYTVSAFVLGLDYMDKRDNLIAALEKKGPGILVHPALGEMYLEALSFTVRESRDEGGMAGFTINFSETAPPLYPEEVSLSASVVSTESANLIESLIIAMKNFSTDTAALTEAALADVNGAVLFIQDSFKPLFRVIENADEVNKSIHTILTNASILLKTPDSLARSFTELIANFENTLSHALAFLTLKTLSRQIAGIFTGRVYGNTPSGKVQKNNDGLFLSLLLFSTAASASIIASNTIFITLDEASEYTAAIDAMIETAVHSITDDSIYQNVIDLRVALHNAVPPGAVPLGTVLKNIEIYTVNRSLPALVLCYELYGSLSNYEDILSRNRINNPCNVSKGMVLKVLSE